MVEAFFGQNEHWEVMYSGFAQAIALLDAPGSDWLLELVAGDRTAFVAAEVTLVDEQRRNAPDD